MSQARWQPVVLILDTRLECDCGQLAVFVSGMVAKEDDSAWLYDASAYCQDCWKKIVEEIEDC